MGQEKYYGYNQNKKIIIKRHNIFLSHFFMVGYENTKVYLLTFI